MYGKKNILLVEDDYLIAMALRIRLIAEGYTIEVADRADRALANARQSLPDAAVIDFNLPDGNGVELMSQMQALSVGRPIPVIITTANTNPELAESAMQKGASGFLEKPFLSEHLLEALEAAF
ncbi:MAG: response regulator [Granulosicoccus sp.]|nr:response regulator [Granulosicoccus sp.]